MKYELEMRDGGSSETVEFDDLPSASEIREACAAWVEGGEWGDDGASVVVRWTLTDEDGDEIDEGRETIDVEPDHSCLIATACGDKWDVQRERSCGDDPDDHDWTAEGVWSVGGTAMTFATHCRKCGLQRKERSTGSQRNPGEHDTVVYEMPEA